MFALWEQRLQFIDSSPLFLDVAAVVLCHHRMIDKTAKGFAIVIIIQEKNYIFSPAFSLIEFLMCAPACVIYIYHKHTR